MDSVAAGRVTDWNAAIRTLFLALSAAGILGLIRSGHAELYIHPRFIPFTGCAAGALVLMALAQAWRCFGSRAGKAPVAGRYVPFLLPLVLALAVPPATFGADLAARQGLNLTDRSATWATSRRVAAASQGSAPLVLMVPGAAPQTVAAPTETASAPPPPPLVSGRVVLDAKTFAPWLLAIYANPQAYIGKPVNLTGFLFRPAGVATDEFVLARLIVTCHVAHALPDGFLVQWPDSAQLPSDSWYQVQGLFEPGRYQGKEVIRIRVQRLTPEAKPADPYIYAAV